LEQSVLSLLKLLQGRLVEGVFCHEGWVVTPRGCGGLCFLWGGETWRHVEFSGANLSNIAVPPMYLSNMIDDGPLIR
jgi:hypothetical protein